MAAAPAKPKTFTVEQVTAQCEAVYGAGFDWSKFVEILMKFLPLILPFFMKIKPGSKTASRDSHLIYALVKARGVKDVKLLGGAMSDPFIKMVFDEVTSLGKKNLPAFLDLLNSYAQATLSKITP